MASFSKTQLNIKEIWIFSLRSYCKILNQAWVSVLTLGLTLAAAFWANKFLGKSELYAKLSSAILSSLLIFVIVYLTSLLMFQAYNAIADIKVSLIDSLKTINKKFFRLAAITILVMIFYIIGLVALIIPGVFIFIVLSMAQPLVLFDDNSVLNALKGSFKLVWGNWWRSFAIIFPLVGINYSVLYLVTNLLKNTEWLICVSNIVIAFIFYPLFYACILYLFNDLKLRKEEKASPVIVT